MLHREKRVRQQRVLGWSVWEKASLKSSLAEGLAGPLLPRNGASVVLGCLAGRGSARHPLRRRGSEVISSWVWSSRSKRGRASVFFTFHPISCVHNPHLPRLETRKRCGAVQPRVRVSSTHPLDCDSRPRAGSSSRRRARSLCGCFFVDRGGARSWRHRAQISQPFAFPDDVLITPSCAQTRPNNRDCPRRPPRSASARRERTSSPHPRRRPGEERERESCCAALLWRSTSKNSSDQVFFFCLLETIFFHVFNRTRPVCLLSPPRLLLVAALARLRQSPPKTCDDVSCAPSAPPETLAAYFGSARFVVRPSSNCCFLFLWGRNLSAQHGQRIEYTPK